MKKDSFRFADGFGTQEYLNAISETDTRINTQMQTWQGYIAELQGGVNTLRQLSTQMNLLAEPLKRELALQASSSLLAKRRN